MSEIGRVFVGQLTESELRSNVRLIGAAQDLLAALKEITHRLELSWDRRDLAPDGDLAAVEAAFAAIEKAEGHAP